MSKLLIDLLFIYIINLLFFRVNFYIKSILLGIISKAYVKQGTNITKAITIGNNIVQQKDINWSKRILGNEALTHININIIIHVFRPKDKPYNNPSIEEPENVLSLCKLFI